MILYKLNATLWKCLKIRQRHYMITIFIFLIPIALYGLLAWSRTKIGHIGKQYINESTYIEPMSEEELYQRYKVDISNTYLLYAPATQFTNKLMRDVQLKMEILNEKFFEFNSDDDLLAFYNKNTSEENVYAVIFDGLDNDEAPQKLNYSIRNYEKLLDWQTDMKFNVLVMHYIPDTGSEKYFHKGFINLQLAIDRTYLQMKKHSNLDVELSMQEFPYPPHSNDIGFTDLFMTLLPLVTLFSTIFIFPGTLKRMMEEKESGIKELMKMMGLPPSIMYFAWFIDALFPVILSAVICSVLMKVTWGTAYAPIEYCNGPIYGIFLLLYFSSCIAFCLFVGALSDSPSITTTFSILVWIITYILPFSISSLSKLGFAFNIILCIIPNFAMYHGFHAISLYEIRAIGVQWNNLFTNASGAVNSISMGYAMIMLLVDIIILLFLGFYFDQIRPGKFGLPKPWNFPITNLFNRTGINKRLKRKNSISRLTDENETAKVEECSLTPGIVINNMTKTYGSLTAVNNMSVRFYEGEIAVLLGRNGAGKTTTMSVLTGMTNATRGEVWINGFNICENLNYVRSVMGICPQHDLLFPELTVFEHIMFFAKLHNVSNATKEVNDLLKELGIYEQSRKLPREISGGMKRKLCLGMAIISNPQILILDEPTSGLDPKSRRDIWDLILNCRSHKPSTTIMVSTHFMEEADVLGDRITIIESGRLVAQGSPMYLKKEFGNECKLTLILKKDVDDMLLEDDYFKQFKRSANIIKKENCYTINLTHEDKEHLITFLDLIAKGQYVEHVGISITTIEDVFLKLARKKNTLSYDVTDYVTLEVSPELSSSAETQGATNFNDWIHRYGGVIYQYRRYVPYMIMACAMILLLSNVGSTQSVDRSSHPELKLQLNTYGKTQVYYSVDPSIDNTIVQEFQRLVTAQGCLPIRVDSVSNALIDLGIKSLDDYKQKTVVGMEFNSTADNKLLINMMYSNLALHGAPIILNLATNVIAKSVGSGGINAANVPLQSNSDIVFNELASEIQIVLLWVILAPIALLFLVSSYIDYPLKERISNFKHLIYMSGVKPIIYWLNMFVFHFVVLYVPAALILFFIILANPLYHHGATAILVLLICYGIMMIPFVFLFSYKKSVASAVGALSILTLFTGLVFPFVIAILKNCGDNFYETLGSVFHVLSHFSPQYWLTNNLITFSRKSVWQYKWDNMLPKQKELTCKINLNPCCPVNGVIDTTSCNEYKSYFVEDMSSCLLIVVTIILFTSYFVLLCLLDSLKCRRVYDTMKKKLKSLVTRRHDSWTLIQNENEPAVFAADSLTKTFDGKKDVVNQLTFKVKPGQCYGLLGINGAGKTTTFKMLTGYEIPTSGTASIKRRNNSARLRLDELNSMDEYFKQIGYCPQFNAINDVLSARTLFRLFANLRGVPTAELESAVTNILMKLTLDDFADVPCGTLSGGNKRKLCLGISLIGKPSVGFLDEPTTGVDPVSRRKIWDVLNEVKTQDRQPLVLTSHSMDECEILCDYLAIMKKGDVFLEGNTNELKALHGKGYTIKIKLNQSRNGYSSNKDEVDSASSVGFNFPRLIQEKMPSEALKVELKDQHEGMLHYFVATSRCGVEDLKTFLQVMEELKRTNCNVEDYTINTSTLEDIFLAVARQSEAEIEEV